MPVHSDLLPLIERYGIEAVRAASLSALGYPLTWIVDASEVQPVAGFFNNTKGKG